MALIVKNEDDKMVKELKVPWDCLRRTIRQTGNELFVCLLFFVVTLNLWYSAPHHRESVYVVQGVLDRPFTHNVIVRIIEIVPHICAILL